MEKIPDHITAEYLRAHPECIFVFGDNTIRKGKGGAATLRDEPNTYGFITKKYPNNRPESFYKFREYEDVFWREAANFLTTIRNHPDKIFLVSKIGAGLANKHNIYEGYIRDWLKMLQHHYPNQVVLLP